MTSPGSPRVSVIMPVYNREQYLHPAIDSILGQTLRDFELIIVDDASTDRSPEILADYAGRDARIRLLRNEINLGPAPTGNRGLATARASIIAPMDSDDISAPERLEREVAFLDAHPDHLLVTTGYRAIDESGRTLYVKVMPADDFGVRWLSRFRMALVHAAACFRAQFPDGTRVRYDETYPVGQDFELFTRLMAAGKAAVLSSVLYDYRMHPSNISTTRRLEQQSDYMRIALQVQQRELPEHLAGSLTDLLRCYLLGEPATPGMVRESVQAFDRMLAHDVATNPSAKTWLRRQSAGILADAILRKGKGFASPFVAAAFIVHARHYLWPLAFRVLEDKGYLPRWLESFPDPEEGTCDMN